MCACLAWVFSRNPPRPSPSFPLGVFCVFCAPCGDCDVGAGGGGVYASDVIAWLQGWERDVGVVGCHWPPQGDEKRKNTGRPGMVAFGGRGRKN